MLRLLCAAAADGPSVKALRALKLLLRATRVERAASLPTFMPVDRSLTSSWQKSAWYFLRRFGQHKPRMRAIIVFTHFTSVIGKVR
jgi:hypothetical protein